MLRSPLPFIRATGERMAINAPIQGTNADIMKLGMIRINDFVEKSKLQNSVKIVLQVHDELIYEIKEDVLEDVIKNIEEILIDIIPKEFLEGKVVVPLSVGVAISSDWGSMK
jgi:DNA polymerase-1